MISPAIAIQKLKQFCVKNNYKIFSQDPESVPFADDVLTVKITRDFPASDRYHVTQVYNGSNATISQGSLVEMMFDFELMKEGETLECNWVEMNDTTFLRRNAIRQPWNRNAL